MTRCYYWCAWGCLRLGFYRDALFFSHRCLRKAAPNASLHALMAESYRQLGNDFEAHLAAFMALELDPTNALAKKILLNEPIKP